MKKIKDVGNYGYVFFSLRVERFFRHYHGVEEETMGWMKEFLTPHKKGCCSRFKTTPSVTSLVV